MSRRGGLPQAAKLGHFGSEHCDLKRPKTPLQKLLAKREDDQSLRSISPLYMEFSKIPFLEKKKRLKKKRKRIK
jgi:hypothetical protein